MNGITPRLILNADRDTWRSRRASGSPSWLCPEVLHKFFAIPATAKAIWLAWSSDSIEESIPVYVHRIYGLLDGWRWSRTKKPYHGNNGYDHGLYLSPNHLLDKAFPDNRPGDTHKLYIQLQYEE